MAAMDLEQRHTIHCPRMDISLYLPGPLNPSAFERLKAGEVWEGFWEYVDLQVSEWEIESNLISGAKFTLAVLFSLYLLPPFINKRHSYLLGRCVYLFCEQEMEISDFTFLVHMGRPGRQATHFLSLWLKGGPSCSWENHQRNCFTNNRTRKL